MEALVARPKRVVKKKKKVAAVAEDADGVLLPSPPVLVDVFAEEAAAVTVESQHIQVEPEEPLSSLALGTNLMYDSQWQPEPMYSQLTQESPLPSYPDLSFPGRTILEPDAPLAPLDVSWDASAFQGHLTSDTTSANLTLLEPSAPPLDHTTIEHLAMTKAAALSIEPLPDEVLTTLFVNEEIELHPRIVDEFRGNAAEFPDNDIFFSRLKEYEDAYEEAQRAKFSLKSLILSTHNLSLRVWTLKKLSGIAEEKCEDGVRLSHQYSSEIGSFNRDELKDLEDTLQRVRSETYSKYRRGAFKAKLIKLWIQNHIDEFLSQSPMFNGAGAAASPYQVNGSRQDDQQMLKHYIDVLFFYEKRKRLSLNGFSFRKFASEQEAEDPSVSVFIRDIRGWISHLVAALLKVAGLIDHRFILLHVLRCEGIGSWGSSFVQWSAPSVWTPEFLNHYFTAIYALFSPIEEVKEALESKELELYEVRESLKKLEDSDWIVVDEDDLEVERDLLNTTVLSEDDYLSVLDQFNVIQTYQSFLHGSTSESNSDFPWTADADLNRPLLHLFAVTSHLLASFSRGLNLFSSKVFPTLIKRVAQMIAETNRSLGEFLLQRLKPWSNDEFGYIEIFDIPVMVGNGTVTSVQAELDSCFFRALKILLNNPRKKVWPFLADLKFESVSAQFKWRLLSNLITGNPFMLSKESRSDSLTLDELLSAFDSIVEKGVKGIASLIRGNSTESVYLLTFLANIVTTSGGSHLTRFPRDEFVRVAVVVAKIVFYFSYMDPQLRETLFKPARDILKSICSCIPAVLSYLLNWVRDENVGSMAMYLFVELPVVMWKPTVADLAMIQSMLKDPFSSQKFQLAKFIVISLDWGYADLDGRLFLPRSHHRFMALAIANLCLDRQSRETRSVISTTSAIATSALAKVGSLALPASMSHFYENHEITFTEWSWLLISGFKLYQRPSSNQTYTLEAAAMGEKPFEPLETAALSTLRGAMRSDPLAAYVVLMVSEIGHDLSIFDREGWNLMSLVMENNHSDAILQLTSDIVMSFARSAGPRFTESLPFLKFYAQFFKSRFHITAIRPTAELSPSDSGLGVQYVGDEKAIQVFDSMFKNYLWMILDNSQNAENSSQSAGIWLKAIFAERDWPLNRSSLRMIDLICEAAFSFRVDSGIHTELLSEYRRLSSAYASSQQSSSKLSILNPVESVYNLAISVGDLYHGYPTLISGIGTGVIWSRFGCEKECIWFAFEALLVETEAESELRHQIGSILSKDPLILLSAILKDVHKPLTAFAIYKWAVHILEAPIGHPLSPLFWQVFFALYFERVENSVNSSTACFGFRFMLEKKDLMSKLEQKLNATVAHYSSIGASSLSDCFNELTRLSNAMALWIRDSRLTSTGVYVEHLSEQFCVPLLKEILQGKVLMSADFLWTQFVPIGALRASFESRLLSVPKASRRLSIIPLAISNERHGNPSLTSIPGPAFAIRQPLISPLSGFTLHSTEEVFKVDPPLIVERGLRFHKNMDMHAQCDADYIAAVKSLYVNEQKRGRIEKRCSASCSGAAVINFRFQEVKMMTDVKSNLKDNRVNAESLGSWDNMDPKVCICALKLLRAVEWLCESEQESLHHSVSVSIFYRMLSVFNTSVRRYPPAAIVLENVVDMIGRHYIATSAAETIKIFDYLDNDNGPILHSVFNPSIAIHEFASMYERLSKTVTLENVKLSVQLFQRFKVNQWLDLCSGARELHISFLGAILSSMEDMSSLTDDLIVISYVDQLVAIHRENLKILIQFAASSVGTLSTVIKMILSRHLDRSCPLFVLPDAIIALNNGKDVNRSVLSDSDLFVTDIGRETLVETLGAISQTFSDTDGLLALSRTDDGLLDPILDLLILLFFSKSLFSMISDVHRSELWSILKSLWLPLLGVIESEGKTSLSPWAPEDNKAASEVTRVLVSVVQKLCRNSSVVEKFPEYLWELYTIVQGFERPLHQIEIIHKYFQDNEVPWEYLSIDRNFVDVVESWSSRESKQSRFSVEVQRFVGYVISKAAWRFKHDYSLQDDSNTALTFVLLVFGLVGNAENLYNQEDRRSEFFNHLREKLRLLRDWRDFPAHDFATVLSVLPLKWQTNVSELFMKGPPNSSAASRLDKLKSSSNSAVRCVDLIWCLIGVECFNPKHSLSVDRETLLATVSKLELFLDYVTDLIATQSSSAAASPQLSEHNLMMTPKTFSPDSIGSVVIETLNLVADTVPDLYMTEKVGLLRRLIRRTFVILNGCNKAAKEYTKIWEGVTGAVRATDNPTLWIEVACQTVASVEHMALIVETCIERHLSLSRDGQDWRVIMKVLEVPELEAENFIRQCLSHALSLTLYTHVLQMLDEVGENADMKLVVGERLGNWIAGLKVEASEDGGEGKIVLLLALFGDLLAGELASLPMPEHHSRLRAVLPQIGDALIKWGQDRANQGLWATLGFGPKSRLSSEFRLFARAVGAFIALRLMGPHPPIPDLAPGGVGGILSGRSREEEQKAKLVEAVTSASQSREYETSWGRIEGIVSLLKDEDRKRISSLSEFVYYAGWFSIYVHRGWRKG